MFDTSGRLNLLRRLLDCVEQGINIPDCEDENTEEDEDGNAEFPAEALEPDAEPEDGINDESHVDWGRDPNEVRVEECSTFIAAYVGVVGLVVEEQRLKKHWYESQKDPNVWIIGVTECSKAKSPPATSLHNQQNMYISP